jgi:hypothetical protein
MSGAGRTVGWRGAFACGHAKPVPPVRSASAAPVSTSSGSGIGIFGIVGLVLGGVLGGLAVAGIIAMMVASRHRTGALA